MFHTMFFASGPSSAVAIPVNSSCFLLFHGLCAKSFAQVNRNESATCGATSSARDAPIIVGSIRRCLGDQ
jgi:hypothetical protein